MSPTGRIGFTPVIVTLPGRVRQTWMLPTSAEWFGRNIPIPTATPLFILPGMVNLGHSDPHPAAKINNEATATTAKTSSAVQLLSPSTTSVGVRLDA